MVSKRRNIKVLPEYKSLINNFIIENVKRVKFKLK